MPIRCLHSTMCNSWCVRESTPRIWTCNVAKWTSRPNLTLMSPRAWRNEGILPASISSFEVRGTSEESVCCRGTKLLIAGMKANYYFSFILECRSASPEVVQVYASTVRGHDSDVHDDDDDVDDGVYHRVARYTDKHSEDSHSNMMAAQRPLQGYRCEYRPRASQRRPIRRPPTRRAWR